jgi:hypothetical protein
MNNMTPVHYEEQLNRYRRMLLRDDAETLTQWGIEGLTDQIAEFLDGWDDFTDLTAEEMKQICQARGLLGEGER